MSEDPAAQAPSPYVLFKPPTFVQDVDTADATRIVMLSQNESCYGPPPGAVEAAMEALGRIECYPDPTSADLRRAIADRYGLEPDGIVCGNGSEELLDLIARAYVREGDEVLFPEHSFIQFRIATLRQSGTPVAVPNGPDFKPDIEALLDAVTDRTRVVFFANPNNPTGVHTPRDLIEKIADRLPPRVLFVHDAAYAEYADAPDYDSGLGLVADNPNVMVTRTFSKAYGLAGLRVGWCYATPEVARAIDTMRGIGNINLCAQAAAAVAIGAEDFVANVCRDTALERTRLAQRLQQLGLDVVASQTNFLLAGLPETGPQTAQEAHARLARHGYVVKGRPDAGLDRYLRITLGLPEDNRRVGDILADFMNGQGG